MNSRKAQVLRLTVALGLVGAITASAMIGSAGAGPGDFVTFKALRKQAGAYSRYHDTAVPILNSGNVADPAAVITSLPLPKGKFVILAKMTVNGSGGITTCRVSAGGDFDESTVDVPATEQDQVILTVTHKFGSAGNAVLSCVSTGGGTSIEDIKLTGMEFPKLVNTAF